MNDIPLIINMIGKSFTYGETGLKGMESVVLESVFFAVFYCKPSGKLSICTKLQVWKNCLSIKM